MMRPVTVVCGSAIVNTNGKSLQTSLCVTNRRFVQSHARAMLAIIVEMVQPLSTAGRNMREIILKVCSIVGNMLGHEWKFSYQTVRKDHI